MPPAPGDDTATAIQPRDGAPSRPTGYVLTVIEGPDARVTHVVDGSQPSRAYVGQSPSCEFRLSDREVSRRHVSLDTSDEGLRVTDLESTNGTYVNGVRVFDALLHGGEVIRVGATEIRVDPAGVARNAPRSTADSFGRLVGSSVEMRKLYSLCEQLAHADVPVVIEGETGTGKELLAESLHERGPRASRPFVVFDCTAVSSNLVESELFGHERGAFTGAIATRKGVFEQAHGGTLLIDEIGELDSTLQPKLLRALERSEVRRVGGTQWIKVDVRVMAATRRDLDREVQDGRFRDDLYFRLAVARIELPPLRARKGDIGVLTHHLWRVFGGTDAPPYELIRRHERYSWPGNVRELANAVARYLAIGESFGDGPSVAPSADAIEETLALGLPYPRARDRVLAEFERRFLERVLAAHGGNVTQAAKASGIGRRYLTQIAARHTK
jgi:two-component system response regulator HydG